MAAVFLNTYKNFDNFEKFSKETFFYVRMSIKKSRSTLVGTVTTSFIYRVVTVELALFLSDFTREINDLRILNAFQEFCAVVKQNIPGIHKNFQFFIHFARKLMVQMLGCLIRAS